MKKYLILTAATALLAMTASVAQAAPAVVVDPAGGCGLFDGNGGFAFTTDSKVTATQSNNGNSMLKCKATVTPATAGGAARFDSASTGAFCVILNPFGVQVTDQWHETVSASGEATLTCHVTGKP